MGYDDKLYILAFDHRGPIIKRFGIEGQPKPEETQRIADGKHLIFEGVEAALERGADPSVTGALVDEQFGGPARVPEEAKARGIKLAMPVEKSGQQNDCVHLEHASPPEGPHGGFGPVLGTAPLVAHDARSRSRLATW